MTNKHESRIRGSILEADLSFEIQGAVFSIANKYGKGLKERIYQKALSEEFTKRGLQFEEQKRIVIYSLDSGKSLGAYVPDFIIGGKIVVEIKATPMVTSYDVLQQRSYLQASTYEIAYLINFNTPQLFIKRSIFTNDRKPFITQITHS